jgi:hypothetical protein
VLDGIITDPDLCEFRADALLCSGDGADRCLTQPQVVALQKIYSPLYDNDELIYSRFDPSAEAEAIAIDLFNGKFPAFTSVREVSNPPRYCGYLNPPVGLAQIRCAQHE